jgi:hypothetical protein
MLFAEKLLFVDGFGNKLKNKITLRVIDKPNHLSPTLISHAKHFEALERNSGQLLTPLHLNHVDMV